MKNGKPILENFFTYGAASAITAVTMFFVYLIAARYLGVEDFGRFSFAVAFVTLFSALLDPGFYYLTTREVARQKQMAAKYLSHALTWKFMSVPLFFLIIWSILSLLHKTSLTSQAVYLMAISQILISFKDAFRPILLAHEFFGLDAISQFIERVSLLICSTLIFLDGKGLLAFCWVFVIVRTIDLSIIASVVQFKVCGISIGRELAFLKHLILSAVPIGAFLMALKVYNYVDTLMLSIMRGDIEVGWYSASYKVYEGPLLIPSVIATVFLPRLSRLFQNNKALFITFLERGTKVVVLTSLIAGINGILFSDFIVNLCFGDMYLNSILALQILFAGFTFGFTRIFFQTVMISVDHQKLIFYVTSFGLLVNVLFNAVLIPMYGYLGAAFATVVAEGMVCAILFRVLQSAVWRLGWWKYWVKPTAIGVGLGILVFGFINVDPVFQAIAWNSAFIGLIFALKILDKEDLEFFTRRALG